MPEEKSILFIDDEADLTSVVDIFFRHWGYSITGATSASEALSQLIEKRFDIICLDLGLPDRNGLSLLPDIRMLHPGVPVLILTGDSSLDTALEAIRTGARGYLVKPITPPILMDRILEIFKQKDRPQPML